MTRRGGASRAASHRTRAAPRRATTRARRRQPDGYGNICTDGEQAVAGGSVEPVEPGPTLPCPDRDRRLRRFRTYAHAGRFVRSSPPQSSVTVRARQGGTGLDGLDATACHRLLPVGTDVAVTVWLPPPGPSGGAPRRCAGPMSGGSQT